MAELETRTFDRDDRTKGAFSVALFIVAPAAIIPESVKRSLVPPFTSTISFNVPRFVSNVSVVRRAKSFGRGPYDSSKARNNGLLKRVENLFFRGFKEVSRILVALKTFSILDVSFSHSAEQKLHFHLDFSREKNRSCRYPRTLVIRFT